MTRVRVERDGRIGRVTLARPEKKNALDLATATELADAFRAFGAETEIRVVVLAADGDDFCSGADLEALEAMLDEGASAHRRDAEALARVFLTMRALPQPVIGAVRGRALAGGAGLATACDLVLAHEGAQFGYPEVRVGFVPAMVMTLLRRSVGEKRAFDLVATGRIVTASEALEIGLVSRVETNSAWAGAVERTAEALANTAPEALQLTKRLFYALDTQPFEPGIALGVDANVEARSTPGFREGVRRFVARSRPAT